ncbi:MAG: ABC transporter permease subunit [Phycisphaerae bacterium]
MMRLAGIVLNTFRETVRRPFYYLLLAGAAAALLATLRLPFFTLGRSGHYGDTDMYKDLGLSFVLVFVLLLAVLGAATSVAKEVEDKTAQTILSKAVGRWQFIVGKYVGVMVAVTIGLVVLGVIFAAAVYYRVRLDAGVFERAYTRGGVGHQIEAFRARQIYQALTITPGIVLVLLQVGVLAAVATAISTRLSSAASVGLSLALFLVGHLTVFLESGARLASAGWQALCSGILAFMPFLEVFNLNERLSHTMLTPFDAGSPGAAQWTAVWAYVGLSALYAAAYCVFALGLGVVLFRRRSL